ncbi:MAG: NAD(P)H-hydrate dehydratase [Kibdelosporangium sp.]
MRGVWTTDRVKAAEQRLFETIPEAALMRRAAFGVAVCAASYRPRRVLLLVGAGNNGGDALWAGAFLRRRGIAVEAVLLNPERAHSAGLAAFKRAGGRIVAKPGRADVAIDGIVGISGKGPLRPDAAELVASVTAPIIAVDLPSGVDPDTGAEDGPCVDADVTVTFGGRKPVHALSPRCGVVKVLDIGLTDALGEPDYVILDAEDIGKAWPIPGPRDDKYTQGVTGIAAGSATYPGAAVLSASGAVLATSGMVRYVGTAAEIVQQRWPEVITTGSIGDAGRVQAWVAGPGIGTGTTGRELLSYVLDVGVPVCVDADGITLLAAHPDLWDRRDPDTPMVITPHDREFARLAPLGKDRVASAKALARRVNAVVLLKGYNTIVAAPDGRVLVNQAPSAWLATAGSGDVLSGILGALLAAGLDPWMAAGCAAWIHGHAGTLAASGAPAPASAIVNAIPEAIRHITD